MALPNATLATAQAAVDARTLAPRPVMFAKDPETSMPEQHPLDPLRRHQAVILRRRVRRARDQSCSAYRLGEQGSLG